MVKKRRGAAVEPEQLEPVDEPMLDSEESEVSAGAALEDDAESDDDGDLDDGDDADDADSRSGRINHRDMYAAEARSVASQQALREQMAREVEEFLARGGRINVVEPKVQSDPPARPESNYGSRPI